MKLAYYEILTDTLYQHPYDSMSSLWGQTIFFLSGILLAVVFCWIYKGIHALSVYLLHLPIVKTFCDKTKKCLDEFCSYIFRITYFNQLIEMLEPSFRYINNQSIQLMKWWDRTVNNRS